MENTGKDNKRILYYIYIINFLVAFSIAIPAYVNSTFLKEYATEKFVGIIYTVGSFLTLIAFINIPKILRKFGNYKTILFLFILQIFLLLGLAASNKFLLIAPIFIIYWTVVPLIKFNLDVFLESSSTDGSTGKIRGIFFTSGNIAWVVAPAIIGIILTNGDYWKIYIAAMLFTLPIFYFLHIQLKTFKDLKYDKVPFFNTLREIWRRKNVYKIFMASFLLWFFYSWMIIYTPIYLHEYIGFKWNLIGPMFTIMLLPFLFIQLPAGRIADIKLGEKELLSIGFIIMAISVGILSFITSTNFWVWAGALFITRIGASIVEIMIETYFFKKIDGTDTHILSLFRNNRAIAYIVAPLTASVFLYFFDLKYIFLVLGIIMMFGLKYSLTLKDTK